MSLESAPARATLVLLAARDELSLPASPRDSSCLLKLLPHGIARALATAVQQCSIVGNSIIYDQHSSTLLQEPNKLNKGFRVWGLNSTWTPMPAPACQRFCACSWPSWLHDRLHAHTKLARWGLVPDFELKSFCARFRSECPVQQVFSH